MKSIIALFFLFGTFCMQAQDSNNKETTAKDVLPSAKFLYPENYNPNQKYPVVVALPYTGGTGSNYMHWYLGTSDESEYQEKFYALMEQIYPKESDRAKHSFIVMLTSGAGSTADHNWEGFSACIDRYDIHIKNHLDKLKSADLDRVYLTGFSLGGDLSWALINKYPKRFKGIIATGTRCGATRTSNLKLIKENNARCYMTMGEDESTARLAGMEKAIAALKKYDIEHHFYDMPFVGHASVDAAHFQEAIRFMFEGKSAIKPIKTTPDKIEIADNTVKKGVLYRQEKNEEDCEYDCYVYVNKAGDVVVDRNDFQIIMYAEDTVTTFFWGVKNGDSKIRAYNVEGQVIFDAFNYDNGPDYLSEGLFRIEINGKIGYANEKGEVVIPAQYDCAMPFENGLAKVAYSCKVTPIGEYESVEPVGNWLNINKKGQLVK